MKRNLRINRRLAGLFLVCTRSLQKNREFKQVYSHGRSAATRLLVLYVLRSDRPGNRLGVSVSKKVGKSVTRSRIKRLIKEHYRLAEDRIERGYDLVFVARRPVGLISRHEDFTEIGRAFDSLMTKHKLWREVN